MSSEYIRCGVSDGPRVIEIVQACAEWLSAQGMNHWKNYYTDEVLLKKLRETIILGVRKDDQLVGIVSLAREAPSYYADIDIDVDHFKGPQSDAMYMSMLATDPVVQRSGVASNLIDYAESESRRLGVRFMRLDVIREYVELNLFYHKREYQYSHYWRFEAGDNCNFYEKQLDASEI